MGIPVLTELKPGRPRVTSYIFSVCPPSIVIFDGLLVGFKSGGSREPLQRGQGHVQDKKEELTECMVRSARGRQLLMISRSSLDGHVRGRLE